MRTHDELMALHTRAPYSPEASYGDPTGRYPWSDLIPTLAFMAENERGQEGCSRAPYIKRQHRRTAEALEHHARVQGAMLEALRAAESYVYSYGEVTEAPHDSDVWVTHEAVKAAIAGAPAVAATPSALAALKAAESALDEALTSHIYDADNGEEPEPDCQYTAALAEVRAAIAEAEGKAPAAAPEPHAAVIFMEGGLVTSVHSSDAAMVGRAVLIVDHDTEGSDRPVVTVNGDDALLIVESVLALDDGTAAEIASGLAEVEALDAAMEGDANA